MMLGFLLARAGIDVVVLEKHEDFLRDFRGDTIHPSTLELMHELGLLDEFLKLPHQKVRRARRPATAPARVTDRRFPPSADALQIHRADAAVGLSEFPRRSWPPLSGLPSADGGRGDRPDRGGRPRRRVCAPRRPTASRYPRRRSSSAATAAIRRCATRPGSRSRTLGAPMDVLWFRLSRNDRRHRADRRPCSMPAGSSSCSIAATTGNAPMSSPRDRIEEVHRAGPAGVPRRHCERGAGFRRPRRRDHRLGSGQAAHRRGRPAASAGTGRACSASATPRTRCRRSAASASISRCRTRSPPPISWPSRCAAAP